ncbi:hypothetical protein MSAN_02422900 [Mycena sanguinolenta]|uniref:Uncharacterized protein n=1 Tax=Mycena sanguinolenta TaxID=230812 RepID=A0A8H7CER3_9AGAR|nr:hypothetical protein MSAN_02422900 [Mycena sanguinolenta]
MPPLTRQRTLESVLSWWSDSNSTGPNINLHSAAKPLMRFLYHRAALDFIAKPRDVLTGDDMDIYCSYLAYKYVSPATKRTILAELVKRAQFHVNAPTIADSMIALTPQLLASTDRDIPRLTCRVFGTLAHQDGTEAALLTFARLASPLEDEHTETEGCETVISLIRSRIALFQVLECAQVTANQKVQAVKGAVSMVLRTSQIWFEFAGTGFITLAPDPANEQTFSPFLETHPELMALAEDLYRLAVTVIEEYKHELGLDMDLLHQISDLELEFDRVHRLQISERSVLAWSASAETTIQALRRDIKQALDMFSVQSQARAQNTIQMVEEVSILGLTVTANDH